MDTINPGETTTLAAMIPVRIDYDPVEDGQTAPPVESGTFVAAMIVDGTAYYWHPKTGEPWVSYAGAYSTETGGGFL